MGVDETLPRDRDLATAWPVLIRETRGLLNEALAQVSDVVDFQTIEGVQAIDAKHSAPFNFYVVGTDFPSLVDAITTLGNTKATLAYGADISLLDDLTVPSNIELLPLNGAVISIDADKTLTYLGSTSRWPIAQLFSGDGSVAGLDVSRPKWFGAVADCIYSAGWSGTDNFNAFRKAIDALKPNAWTYGGFYPAVGKLIVDKGDYFLSAVLELKKPIIIEGVASGQDTNEGSHLVWAGNTSGIVVNRYNTFNNAIELPTTTGADGSIIRCIALTSSHTGAADNHHGIWLRARAIIEDCVIESFSGNGINIVADAGGGDTFQGNSNNFQICRVTVRTNNGHGIYVLGGDTNAGTVIGVNASNNGGYGVYDSSFLGNTYIGVHTAGNSGGAFKADNAAARNIFIGCYSEGGQPASDIAKPSMVIGGLHGAGFVTNGSGYSLVDGLVNSLSVDSAAGHGRLSLGGIGSDALMQLTDQQDSAGTVPISFKQRQGGFYWDWANSGTSFMSFMNQSATTGNGYPRNFPGGGAVGFDRGFYFGAGLAFHTEAAAMPTAGTWKQGDIVWNTAPTAGSPVGYWLRLTTGSNNVLNTDWVAK